MFDIGFAELLIIAVVGLLVIGPERLPGAIRTGSAWLNRFRRGFNDIKREVQQELHNDAVMQELRKTSQQVRDEADRWRSDIGDGESGDSSGGTDATKRLPDAGESGDGDGEPPGHDAPGRAATGRDDDNR